MRAPSPSTRRPGRTSWHLKPANLSFEQAAVIPISAMTALQALRDKGQVKPGHKVLIIGAGGGVGTFAVQIAKAFGAEVTGVCSTSKVDLVESIGADHVIDYTREDFADRHGPVRPHHRQRRQSLTLSAPRRPCAPRGPSSLSGARKAGAWVGPADRIISGGFALAVREAEAGGVDGDGTSGRPPASWLRW